jgi:hypothetical protein
MKYRIWTGLDGEVHSSREDAVESVRVFFGWAEAYTVEHCGGFAIRVYPTEEDADEDADGEYATITVRDIDVNTPEWEESHICPVCGTRAPDVYNDEAHPAWECAVCRDADEED